MCYLLYLGAEQPLPAVTSDARYPGLTIEPILDSTQPHAVTNTLTAIQYLDHVRHLIPQVQYVYDVAPTGLCGCYFEHAEHSELEAELQDVSESEMTMWVSTTAYPDVDPKVGARLWWERKHTAVTSLGRYLAAAAQYEPVVLYVAFEGDVSVSAPEQQTITPGYFTQAQSLSLESNTLFKVVAEGHG